jgi:DNA-binding transcriptional regulator YiaG
MDEDDVIRLVEVRRRCRSGEARQIRVSAGLSLPEMAEPVGVDQATVSRWERGARLPRGKAALRYADLLDRLTTPVTS